MINCEDIMSYDTCVTVPKFKYGYVVNGMKFEMMGIYLGDMFLPVPFFDGGVIASEQFFQIWVNGRTRVIVNEACLKAEMEDSGDKELERVEL